jgi:hypothetical protein
MNTDKHRSFLKKTETKRSSYGSGNPGSIRPILAARQSQKSPLRPPFLKGGWGDFREAFSTKICLTKSKDFAKQQYRAISIRGNLMKADH